MLPENLLSLPDRLSNLSNSPTNGLASPNPNSESTEAEAIAAKTVDDLLKRFSSIIQKPFTELSSSYPASQKEAEDVQNALAKWVSVTVNSLNTGGPERPDGF